MDGRDAECTVRLYIQQMRSHSTSTWKKTPPNCATELRSSSRRARAVTCHRSLQSGDSTQLYLNDTRLCPSRSPSTPPRQAAGLHLAGLRPAHRRRDAAAHDCNASGHSAANDGRLMLFSTLDVLRYRYVRPAKDGRAAHSGHGHGRPPALLSSSSSSPLFAPCAANPVSLLASRSQAAPAGRSLRPPC